MCNPELLLGLVLTPESAVLVALGLVFAAMLASSNPFSSGGSPVLLGIALGALALAIGALSTAVANLGLCTLGPCGPLAETFRTLTLGLLVSLTVLSAAAASIEICRRGLPGTSTAGEVAIVLGYAVLAVGIITAGAVGNRSPFGTTKP